MTDGAHKSLEAHLAETQAALKAAPGNITLLIHYAHLLMSAGDVDGALEQGMRAASLTPANALVMRSLSGIQMMAGRLEAALSSAEEAVRLSPHDNEARIHCAGLLTHFARPRDAVAHLLLVTQNDPLSAAAWRMLSGALGELGRRERAIEAVDHAIAAAPDQVEYRVHRASILIEEGRYEQALADLNMAVELAPQNAVVWRARSGLMETLGDWPRAADDARRALELAPDNPDYEHHLSHLLQLHGLDPAGPEIAPEIRAAKLAEEISYWTTPPAETRPGRSRPHRALAFRRALEVQGRVVSSLILRETRTRYGHSRLGYFWAVFEPIGHLVTLGSVFSLLNHGRPPLGTDLYVFYVTGLLPFLLFSHVTNDLTSAISSNSNVLQLPIIRQLDVIFAKGVLALATEILVGIIAFGGFILLGRPGMPASLMPCILAVLVLWSLGMGIGMVNLVVASIFPAWETIFAAILRLGYFSSGIYYTPINMPDWARDILVWNPVLQGVEWFRSGFFQQYEPHWLDRGYVLMWTALVLLLGLSLVRVMHRKLVVFA